MSFSPDTTSSNSTARLNIASDGRSSSRFVPLEEVSVNGVLHGEGRLLFFDGGGNIYNTRSISGGFAASQRVGGELGWHRIRLESKSGNSLAEARFWVDAQTDIQTDDGPILRLWRSLQSCVMRSQRSVLIDGKVVPFFIRWVRDDTHVQKASVYWARETGSWMECFIDRQAEDGMIYDYACRPERAPVRPEVFGSRFSLTDESNGIRWERLPSEADVEYLLVENVHRAWQASGDDERMARLLPSLDKALRYCMESPLRWAGDQKLVKRPYTIDTWDFKFFGFDRDHLNDEKSLQDAVFNVHPDTPMCVMHGDNSGMYQACQQLASMYRAVGQTENSQTWADLALHFKKRTNEVCWNGEYYDHWVPVVPLDLDQGGVDGSKSFTLSNAYNLNRGIADHDQCASIISKYRKLKDELGETHIAEWLAAHPCWPKGFSGVAPGRYVNGGILTIVAGELARGAFSHGFESYGLDILERLAALLKGNIEEADRDPELFVQPFLFCGYTPEGEAMKGIPDAWGQAAVVAAFVGGLAGVVDRDRRFLKATVSPRWAVSSVEKAEVCIRYPASDGYVAYRYLHHRSDDSIELEVTGNAEQWRIEILLPKGCKPIGITREGRSVAFEAMQVEKSVYAVLEFDGRINDRFVVHMEWIES